MAQGNPGRLEDQLLASMRTGQYLQYPWLRAFDNVLKRYREILDRIRLDGKTLVLTNRDLWEVWLDALGTGSASEDDMLTAMWGAVGLAEWWMLVKLQRAPREALRLSNWAVLYLQYRADETVLDDWGKFIDDLQHPIMLLNAPRDDKVRSYNVALKRYLEEPLSGGAKVQGGAEEPVSPKKKAFVLPPGAARFERLQKVSTDSPVKTLKLQGGAALPVHDMGGILMADATIVEDAFKVMQDRIGRLEVELAQVNTKQAAPQRPRSRSYGRGGYNNGNRTLACYNCGSTTHLARQCPAPKKDATTQGF
jgi:hypothetical protein